MYKSDLNYFHFIISSKKLVFLGVRYIVGQDTKFNVALSKKKTAYIWDMHFRNKELLNLVSPHSRVSEPLLYF